MADLTVLIPLDGSPLAEHSLAYLPGLAHLGDVTLHLLSVVDQTEEIHSLSSAEVIERERHVLTTYLQEAAIEIESLVGPKAIVEVQVGIPAEVIQKRAEELSPDLLVVSTHGRSGISRWRHGSVAAKLLHLATCPILVVGPNAIKQGELEKGYAVTSFHSILVPLDGSDLAEEALSTAASISQQFGSEIHLVRAVSPRLAGDPAGSGDVDMTLELQEGAASYLARVRDRLHGGGDVVTRVLIGAASNELDEYILDQKIDLVVMTSHGRSGLARAALGSVTDRLSGNGKAPVLVVRSRPR
jgi:nucleotide-binding universal stress UspA family protein